MIVVLDAGHGGRDPGAVYDGLYEKDITLDLCKRIKNLVEEATNKVTVLLTRNDDDFISLSERCQFANGANADYFISIHVNAGGGTGIESYTYNYVPQRTIKMNREYHANLVGMLAYSDRGLKHKNMQVLRDTRMPAILIENLFIDNESDRAALKDKGKINEIAAAHCESILKLAHIRSPSPPHLSPNFRYISLSDRGNDVKIVQIALLGFGFNVGAIDGICGDKTVAAIKSFQEMAGINVDGIFGIVTLNAVLRLTP